VKRWISTFRRTPFLRTNASARNAASYGAAGHLYGIAGIRIPITPSVRSASAAWIRAQPSGLKRSRAISSNPLTVSGASRAPSETTSWS